MPLYVNLSLGVTLIPSIDTSMPFKEFNSIPVAVTIISVSIFLPEFKIIPLLSNSAIVSVTTDDFLSLIDLN